MKNKRFYTATDVKEILNVSLSYTYKLIRRLNAEQEEYLFMVDYNVHSYMDLFKLRDRLKDVNDELCSVQKEMYRERAMQKCSCKTY